jgi:hypothetical protein
VILAAMDGDKLLSYQETFAVGDTASPSSVSVTKRCLVIWAGFSCMRHPSSGAEAGW